MKRIIIFSLIALVAAGSVSAQKKAKKAKTSKQPKIEVAAPAAPDTVSVDRFSYAIAQAVVTGLLIAAISFVQIKFTNDRKVE